MNEDVPWHGSFAVDGSLSAGIRLTQIGLKQFRLESTVRYLGRETGLEGRLSDAVIDELRNVGPQSLPVTDLTSVPTALRWFVSQYGAHTPAALIHDRLIGVTDDIEGLTDPRADRFFRFMLRDVGVRWIRRWLMWAAVALRTRYKAGGIKQWSVVIWCVASIVGMVTAVWATLTSSWFVLLLTALAPFLFAVLWWRQYGAGVAASYAAPWLVPPTLFGFLGFLVYAALEAVAGKIVDRRRRDEERLTYEAF
jgi:hypothetical protein